MRKHLHWALTASLGFGGLAFMGCERNNSGTPQASNTSNSSSTDDSKIIKNKEDASRIAGSKIPGDQIGTADLTKIYGVLGDTAEAAFTNGGFNDLVERLAEPDRKRLGSFAQKKYADLDGRVDALNKDYKGKYNGKFSLDKSKVFENWAQVQKAGENSDKTFVNVMIPAAHGLPALTIPMVKDNQAFRIDLPDDVSGEQLKQNLLDHLTAVDNMKDQWPADQLEAQRAMVHHVLAAVLNKPMQK